MFQTGWAIYTVTREHNISSVDPRPPATVRRRTHMRNPSRSYLFLINIISYRSSVTFSFSSTVTRHRPSSEAVREPDGKSILRACAEAYFRPFAHTYICVLGCSSCAATGVLLIKVAATKTNFHVYSSGSFVFLLVRKGSGKKGGDGVGSAPSA